MSRLTLSKNRNTKLATALKNAGAKPSGRKPNLLDDYVAAEPDKEIAALQARIDTARTKLNALSDDAPEKKKFAARVAAAEAALADEIALKAKLVGATSIALTQPLNPPAPAPEAKKPQSLLCPLSLTYLEHSVDKILAPMHPNFVAAMQRRRVDPNVPTINERRFERLRLTLARNQAKHKGNVKAIIVYTGVELKDDAIAYVQLYKQLMANVAFQAHMDASAYDNRITDQAIADVRDVMLEDEDVSHEADLNDAPVADVADAQRAPEREAYAGGERPEPLADSLDDAEHAVHAVQAWIGLAMGSLNDNQRTFHNVDGLFPLGQRQDVNKATGEIVYTNLVDFETYRAYQRESWSKKRQTVGGVDSTELMLAM